MYISLRNPWEKTNKMFPGPKRNPGKERGTDRNRRVSSPLSPISYLFLAPSGKLSLKVQDLLAHNETYEANPPPMCGKRRPGPKHPADGLPPSHWPMVLHRVMEKNEPLPTVAAAYGVSQDTTRRLLLHVQKPRGQPEASRDRSFSSDRGPMPSCKPRDLSDAGG